MVRITGDGPDQQTGRPGRRRLWAAAAAQDRTGSLIETGALRALALAVTGNGARAVTALAEAILLGCPDDAAGSAAQIGDSRVPGSVVCVPGTTTRRHFGARCQPEDSTWHVHFRVTSRAGWPL